MNYSELQRHAHRFCEEVADELTGRRESRKPVIRTPIPPNALEAIGRFKASAPSPAEPELGQVWVAVPKEEGGVRALALLTHVEHDSHRCVVLTPELWIADSSDIIVPGEACPGGEALAACLFLDLPVVPGSLRHMVGRIAPTALNGVLASLRARVGGDIQRALEAMVPGDEVTNSGLAMPELLRWKIHDSERGEDHVVLSGPRLVGGDPRIAARAALQEATWYLAERALARHEEASEEATEAVAAQAVSAVKRWRDALHAGWSDLSGEASERWQHALGAFTAGILSYSPPILEPARATRGAEGKQGLEDEIWAPNLGVVSLLVRLSWHPEALWIEALAVKGTEPVGGVALSVSEQLAGSPTWSQLTGSTDDQFGVARFRVPYLQGRAYSLAIEVDGERAERQWRW